MSVAPPIPLGRAHMLASAAMREARRAGIAFETLTPTGGLRRFAPAVDEVALLGIAPQAKHPQLLRSFSTMGIVSRLSNQTATSVRVAIDHGVVTLHLASPEQAATALVWHTGSPAHLGRLRNLARARGLRLRATGVSRDASLIECSSEADVYAALGLSYVPPELREGDDEIDAAAAGPLPQFVTDLHIRGDLHMHSSWSDGRNTLEEMVLAAQQLGYEYIAITDHSYSAMASRTLGIEDVPRQRAAVEELRLRTPGMQILHGVEVDIMPDGSLDFDDELLGGFDIVLASLHDRAGHGRERLTERYLGAIRHPLVNVITHPANRSPAQSPGYDLDFDRLFEAAADTGTAMEIDGAPGHLDMDGAIARRAAAAGVTITIDSDGHRAESLGRQMRFGVGTARRGRVEQQHVLNARGVQEVREFVARKRAGA